MKFIAMLLYSTFIFLASTAKLPIITEGSNDTLYHLVCNRSNIQQVFYYPIINGRVAGDSVFNPLQIYLEQLTQAAVDYMTPMCARLNASSNEETNHEWFISNETFSRPLLVRPQFYFDCIGMFISGSTECITILFSIFYQVSHGNQSDEEIRYNRMKRYVVANISSQIQIVETESEEGYQ